MKRVICIFLTASMLVAATSVGFISRTAQTQSQPTLSLKLRKPGFLLPPGAGSRLTSEMMDLWARMDPDEQTKMIELFISLVRPALQSALDVYDKQGIPTTTDVIDTTSSHHVRNLAEEPPPTNEPPVVWMTVSPNPPRGPSPLTIQFAQYAVDPDGYIDSYFWEFGDGQTSTQPTVTHTYAAPGSYTARITVTDSGGATGSYAAIITVLGGTNQPPHVSIFASPSMGPAPLTVNFNTEASDPDGQVVSYSWDFGDGMTSSQVAPSHTYQSIGDYVAILTVTDNFGATAIATAMISATAVGTPNHPPLVTVTAVPLSGQAPLTVNFMSSASDPDGHIASYSWSFGDGGTSTLQAPTHTYISQGDYSARLTVTDNEGATASASVIVNVTAQPPPPPIQDTDGDGLPDSLENQLASNFMPGYFVSAGERAGTGLSTFQDRGDQQVVLQVFPTSPPTVVTYYRVLPLGFRNPLGFIQVDYLTLWNRDDGLSVGGDCEAFLDLLANLAGFSALRLIEALSPHAIDNERSIVRLKAPKVGGDYNPDPSAYSMDFLYTVSHEDKLNQIETLTEFVPPAAPPLHIGLALSRAKHGTYPFDPDHLVLMPPFLIFAIYAAVDATCAFVSPAICLFLNFIADTVIFSCFVERFDNQGGVLPQVTANVGEPSMPTSGSHFIQVQELANKLQKHFRIP